MAGDRRGASTCEVPDNARGTRPGRDNLTGMFNGIGPMELVIVLVIALIVLGPKRLPEVGRSLGRGMREFKESVTGDSRHHDDEDDDDVATTLPANSAK